VGELKTFLSACFAIDIAPWNMKLRICRQLHVTENGKKIFEHVEINDPEEILGYHRCVGKSKMLLIWVSKKDDRDMWHLFHDATECGKLKMKVLMDDNDYEDAEKLLMDSWYDFVCAEMKTINTYLDYNEQVWYECGEKEKFMQLYQNKPFYKASVEHVEERQEKFDLL
jgi:hypothetical protein